MALALCCGVDSASLLPRLTARLTALRDDGDECTGEGVVLAKAGSEEVILTAAFPFQALALQASVWCQLFATP